MRIPLLFILICWSSISYSQDIRIDGRPILCPGECAFYTIVPSQNPDLPVAVWNVTDDFGNEILSDTTYDFHRIELCNDWGNSSAHISVTYLNQSWIIDSMTVLSQVLDLTVLLQIPCTTNVNTGSFCTPICQGTITEFFVEQRDQEISWEISGGRIIEQDFDRITVEWTDLGTGQVFAYGFGSACTSYGEYCVEVVPQPIAHFTAFPSPNQNVLEVCANELIYFENQSTGSSRVQWSFGDGTISDAANPVHAYDAPGTYSVQLDVDLGCECRDTSRLIVEVIPAQAPTLTCVSTLCPGAVGTYFAESTCTTFTWSVSPNGRIVDGGGSEDDFISVEWTNGPDGIITLLGTDCTGNACPEPVNFRVPIISTNGPITGDVRACPGDYSVYTAPSFEGVEYQWSVSQLGTIVSGQGSNQVEVAWDGDNVPNFNQWISVTYDNCYLDCQGQASLDVDILGQYRMLNESQFCEGSSKTIVAYNYHPPFGQVMGDWQVYDSENNLVQDSSGADIFLIDENLPAGAYTAVFTAASPDDYCTPTGRTTFKITPKPTPPATIDGPEYICPGNLYAFSTDINDPGLRTFWRISDGGTEHTYLGTNIEHNFSSSGPYVISVHTIEQINFCRSSVLTDTIPSYPLISIQGDADVCAGSVAEYRADLITSDAYIWTISPPEAGVIITENNRPTVEIYWQLDGPATVSLEQCGVSASYPVDVKVASEIILTGNTEICTAEETNIEVTSAFADIAWENEQGAVIGNTSDIQLPPGVYTVQITDNNGCVSSDVFEIIERPLPEAFITTSSDKGFCDDTIPPNTILEANTTGSGYTYQWYKEDSELIGETNSTYVTNAYGNYEVLVTNEFGCSALSNILELYKHCDPDLHPNGGSCNANPRECPPDDVLDFTVFDGPFCNEKTFKNSGAFIGAFTWYFEDPQNNTWISSTDPAPSYTFPTAGYYNVVLDAQVASVTDPDFQCWLHTSKVVEVPVAARFDAAPVCEGAEMAFQDRSTYLPAESIVSWKWNFGDPASGPDNISTDTNPVHLFSGNGKFEVTLEIEAASGCVSVYTDSVTVRALPQPDFLSASQSCAGKPAFFQALDTFKTMTWTFGDPGSGLLDTASGVAVYHKYESINTYTATLTAADIYGCSNVIAKPINITGSSLSGNITSNLSPACEGDTVTLTAPPAGLAWEWNTGDSSEVIHITSGGNYSVTVTDQNGCTYEPPGLQQEFDYKPPVSISIDVLDNNGNFLYSSLNSVEICQGQRIRLNGSTLNSAYLTWSTGETGRTIERTPAQGTHAFQVTATRNITGCTNESKRLEVVVHPNPSVPILDTSVPDPICEGSPATITISNYDPAFEYRWNTGAVGNEITASVAGSYFVEAVSPTGCTATSGIVQILEAPDATLVPSGCLVRCNPDTICLPAISNVANYQWFRDGSAIPAPEGNEDFLIASQDGIYQVELTGTNGCTSISDELELDVLDGYGMVEVSVYADINGNGIIDAGDLEVSGIGLDVLNNGMILDQCVSSGTGTCTFINVQAGMIEVVIDLNTVPADLAPLYDKDSIEIIGCDNAYEIEFLLIPGCQTDSTTYSVSICEHDSLFFNDRFIHTAGIYLDTLTNAEGCDSFVEMRLSVRPQSQTDMDIDLCQGDSLILADTVITEAGTYQQVFTDRNGCDSVLQYNVNLVPAVGEIRVTVYFDDNDNGAIDGGDSRLANIDVLANNGVSTLSGSTNTSGEYTFSVLPEGLYDIRLDLPSLIDPFIGIITFDTVRVEGCGRLYEVHLLVGAFLMPDTTRVTAHLCPDDNINIDGELINRPGTYEVTYTNAGGADSLVIYTITATPSLTLTSSIHLSLNQAYQISHNLEGVPHLIYAWTPSSGLSCDDCPAPIVQLQQNQAYTVEITDTVNGCSITGMIAFSVAFDDRIYIPNAFSPNGDGINDVFRVYVSEDIGTVMEFALFNRWGDLVFRAPQNIGLHEVTWDGRQNGSLLNPQVLVYIIEIQGRDGIIRKYAGDLTLIR